MADFWNEVLPFLFIPIIGIVVNVLPLAGLVWIILSIRNFFRTPKTEKGKRHTRGIMILLSLIVTVAYLVVLGVLVSSALSHM